MAVALLGACVSTPAQGPAGKAPASRALAPGVAPWQFTDASGPWVIHVVSMDLRRTELQMRHLRARDQLTGREKTSEMVRRVEAAGTTVVAAVNADFFWLTTGENENNQVIDGEWWKGLKVTDSPYDTFDNAHVQFALDASGRPSIERYVLDGMAWFRTVPTPILTVNFNPRGNPEGTALFTSRYGATTPRDTMRTTAEAPMAAAGRRGDTLLFVRRGAVAATSGSLIPANGAVLSAYGNGSRVKEVQAMADGDTVRVLLTTLPRLSHGAVPALLIGGWPRILRDGENIATRAPSLEGTISRNAEVRHPRTAIGFSRDSATLYLVTVDGRSQVSVGATLEELAEIMRRIGAWEAMNFDGGGSTAMVIGGKVVNVTSDPTGEREVGNALAILRRP